MKRIQRWLFCFLSAALAIHPLAARPTATPSQSTNLPRVFVLDGKHLLNIRKLVRGGDKNLLAALERLERESKQALAAGPFSVVDDLIAPSGDRHDYMSQAPYFWPNPETTNRLPYVRRDGQRNPEISKFPDHRRMDEMVEAVETLALVYFFKGDEECAAKATRLLRVWFLDSATRMNPHLQYAQAIPGLTTGRGIGLIETRGLIRVVDAVGLLEGAKSWTDADQRALEQWFDRFLRWMQESRNGLEEAAARNNHGTYYDLQVASFALFVGKTDVARNVLQTVGPKRIATQIESDGRQPFELTRTKAWSYSIGNLQGLMTLARLGENVGVELWQYQSADGRSIRKALDYLVPFALTEKNWPHQQLGGVSREALFPLIRKAALKFPDGPYQQMLLKLPSPEPDRRSTLLQVQPKAPVAGTGS
jgi:hypothetical protein